MQETKEIIVETQKNAEKISLQQIHFVLYSFIKRIFDIILNLINENKYILSIILYVICKKRGKEYD